MFQFIVLLTVALFLWGVFGMIGAIISLFGTLIVVFGMMLTGNGPWVNKARERECIKRAERGYQFWD
jgi:hypothetical protein